MSHSVRRHLKLDVDAYDASIRQFIPGYEAMIRRAAREVAATRPGTVVELGAGTGALSAALLEEPGVGSVVAVDIDTEMLERARARLAPYGERARFHEGSFLAPLPPFQAAAASLALHHIATLEEKERLFRAIRKALPEDGVLVNADVCMPDTEPDRSRIYRKWADHLVASGIGEDQAWQHFDDWSAEDHYLPLEAELAALDRAGFEARCVWRDDPATVVVARPRSTT